MEELCRDGPSHSHHMYMEVALVQDRCKGLITRGLYRSRYWRISEGMDRLAVGEYKQDEREPWRQTASNAGWLVSEEATENELCPWRTKGYASCFGGKRCKHLRVECRQDAASPW